MCNLRLCYVGQGVLSGMTVAGRRVVESGPFRPARRRFGMHTDRSHADTGSSLQQPEPEATKRSFKMNLCCFGSGVLGASSAHENGRLDRSPAALVRPPRTTCRSRTAHPARFTIRATVVWHQTVPPSFVGTARRVSSLAILRNDMPSLRH